MKIEPSKNDAASDVEKDAPKEVPKPRQNVGFATIAAVLLFVGNEVQSVVVRNTGVPANQTIPPELALLTQLKTLQLSNNQIAQSFETLLTSTLVPMEHLAELSLDQNHLEGSIPTELGLMSNSLISLRLWDQNSKLVGSIPSEIGRLSQLEVLDLGVNDFTGQIPSTIGFLTSLTSLLFRKNSQLAGTLPPQIGLLTKLTKLDFGYCTNMQGSIPTEYGALSKLADRSIWLNRNSLTGTIPTEIGRWTDMGLLLVNGNNLKGAIPTQIGLMEGLEEISMYENQLEGPIPSELGLLTDTKKRLTRVYLYDNALTGQVPTELVSLWENGSLEGLRLQNNDLSGTIPEGLCGMGKVENQDDWWEHGLWFDCNDKLCGCSWCPCA
ncbi:Leucine rich repeat N-terminal domain [Seminavis robusta]|uniref:Leucine rich repeat N-terminal domain n=1 Tax=Seminavis robusta TaxID=568900 RepID=A0A9N8E6C0_9STRA|nr:Leucine rich repeat N-terminal domain [Seminavis robusta]|eukprot:Sro668_g184270.1 Leucine rich repeat N-terminal domain (382) ;mRNA; f:4478-6187